MRNRIQCSEQLDSIGPSGVVEISGSLLGSGGTSRPYTGHQPASTQHRLRTEEAVLSQATSTQGLLS